MLVSLKITLLKWEIKIVEGGQIVLDIACVYIYSFPVLAVEYTDFTSAEG